MVREARLHLSHGATRYLDAGQGWPVVLLHAFPLSADMWRAQLSAAPEGYRLIAPDLRGFGAPGSQPAHTMDEMASGVAELLDALHIERAVLGGLSMGGYVMFALLRQQPGRFNALVLADTRATADNDSGRAARTKMLETVRTNGVRAVADEMLPKLLGETSRRERPHLLQEVRALIEPNTVDGVAGAIEALRSRPDSTGTLASIDIPTLIICGEEDTLTPPADSRAMQTRIARSRVVILPRAGHLSNVETPDMFSAALADFLIAPL